MADIPDALKQADAQACNPAASLWDSTSLKVAGHPYKPAISLKLLCT